MAHMLKPDTPVLGRGPLDYAVVGKTHATFRWIALALVTVAAVGLAAVWGWGAGWVVALLAGALAAETYRRRNRPGNPQVTIIIDATAMAAAVIVTNVPVFSIAAPYLTLIIAAVLFLPGPRALVAVLYTTAVTGGAALLAQELALRTWQPGQALAVAVIITGSFLLLVVAVLVAGGRAVTSRDALDAAVRRSELRFRTLAASAPVGVFLLDQAGRCTYANRRMDRLLGRSAVGMEFLDFAHPDDAASLSEIWRSATVEYEVEARHRVLDAGRRTRWAATRLARTLEDQGDTASYVGTTADITEHTLAEHDRNRFSAILETTTDLVGIIDTNLEFVYLNQAARTTMGIADTTPLEDIDAVATFTPESGEVFQQKVLVALRESGRWRGELKLYGPGGTEVPVSFVFLAHAGPTGRVEYFSGLGRDITDLRESERRLEQMVRSKDEFIASVSHELRTPLTAVVGLANELHQSRNLFGEEEINEFISLIAGQSAEVANIVEDLLVAARADIGTVAVNLRVVDLHEEASRVISTWTADSPVSLSGGTTRAVALADPGRTRQILRNLLTNATRYGGDRIEVRVTNGGPVTNIQVRDDGPGVPSDMQSKIFDPYSTAHERNGQPASVGLGLTVSRQLARLMGGDLVYRREGRWSVFELSLPTAAREQPPDR